MIGTVLLVILIVILVGALPTWPHSVSWGYGPSGGVGLIVILEVGGALFDAIGPYAPFTLIGVGNLAVMAYARWVARTEPGRWPRDLRGGATACGDGHE